MKYRDWEMWVWLLLAFLLAVASQVAIRAVQEMR